ncbi:MAG: radical SAM protein [uncultured bacterium]|nr:MAG: radical SAM protein [uncultured bacterium]
MIWELYPTTACNLRCTYCYNAKKNHPLKKFSQPNYKISELVAFLKRYSKPGDYISLIGGEPFLRVDWIRDVMRAVAPLRLRYSGYTNGTLLAAVPKTILKKFHHLSISVDGGEQENDRTRGRGTFQKILKNIKLIKPYFRGQLIARMTVTRNNNLFDSVKKLLPHFDLIYWQYENKADLKKFPLEQKLNELTRLTKFWLKELKSGHVVPLYPFLAITRKLLNLNDEKWRGFFGEHVSSCGAGTNYFQVFTTGKVFACPELLLEQNAEMGDVKNGIKRVISLKNFSNTQKCHACPEFAICHCRCLHFTPPEYCVLIKAVIVLIRKELPLIQALIKQKTISKKVFAKHDDLEEVF